MPTASVRHVVDVLSPTGTEAPVVFDSPHSGRRYPADFQFACPFAVLRQAEDALVDTLILNARAHGVTVVNALFPRSYIDVNRAIFDIDTKLLDEPWPGPIDVSEKGRYGMGLVRRLCRPGIAMYNRRLSVAEIQARIEHYYRPYHAALRDVLDRLHDTHGAVWHVNCHSMPSGGILPSGAAERADFVVGDLDGRSCERGFRDLVVTVLRDAGYSVLVNDPYKGMELVQRHGHPRRNRHSLQLEINRRLYLDETTLEPTAGFGRVADLLSLLAERLAGYCAQRLAAIAAD